MSDAYKKAIDKMEHEGEGDSETCKSAREIKAAIDKAIDMGTTNPEAVKAVNRIIEAHWPKVGSAEHNLLIAELKDAERKGGTEGEHRGRAALISMLLRAIVH